MKKLALLGLIVTLAACSGASQPELVVGNDVTLEKRDGVLVSGRLIEVQPEQVVLQTADGTTAKIRRADIAQWKPLPESARSETAPAAASTSAEPPPATGPRANDAADEKSASSSDARAAESRPSEPPFREVTIPAGTVLPLTLRTAVGSDTSEVEDQVRATVRRAVTISGVEAIPAGTAVIGHVTNAKRSAKVKGRGEVAFRFTRLDLPGEGAATNIRTATVARTAPATKKRDAATIGGGAVGGAIIGGIIGGGDGAAKGAAIGGAAGTGAVLATRGAEVRIAAGAPVSVRLTAPITVRVRR